MNAVVPRAGAPALHLHQLTHSRSGLPFDENQLELIRAEDDIVIGEAKAGAGKTTTAIGYADARRPKRGLYLCFGHANAEEARQRFGEGSNVTSRTGHSLAFGAVGHKFKDRVVKSWRPSDISAQLGVDTRVGACIGKTLAAFYASTDAQIGEKHLAATADWGLSPAESGQVMDGARRAWREMNDTGGTMPLVHDSYLKMWAMTSPKLDYDFVIADEWQDSNPLIEQLVNAQLGRTKLLAIGDRHQSIFGFRGATNAMENLRAVPGARVVTMPRTWRFGPQAAETANLVLQHLKGETVPIIGMGKDGGWQSRSTLLTRTNAGLFDEAIARKGEGMHWVGGVKKYNLDVILDGYMIWVGRRGEARDPYMRRFNSWTQVLDYAESARDAEVRSIIRVVEAHRHAIPELIAAVKRNEVKDPAHAELILTTAHGAKGLEWPCVRLGNDFSLLFDAEQEYCANSGELSQETIQELNLLYVALTRAKSMTRLNDETAQWLQELPTLATERERALESAALQRQRA